MASMLGVNILDPNLHQTHPTLVPWVNGMRHAGYSDQQIAMYFNEQIRAQMQQQQRQPQEQRPQQQQRQNQMRQQRFQSQQQNNQNNANPVAMIGNENPIDIVLVLLDQYPQIETWLQNMEYHHTVTSSRDHATDFLTTLMDQQPQFRQFIRLIKQQLEESRRNENINGNVSQRQNVQEQDQNNALQNNANRNNRNDVRNENDQEMKEEIDYVRAENEKLNKKMSEMQKRLDILEARRERVNRLNLDQLIELKGTMQDKIKLIEEAEKRLMDNIRKCVVCVTNDKNIAFDGCEHIALCAECEQKIEEKKCPICRVQYTNVRMVKFN